MKTPTKRLLSLIVCFSMILVMVPALKTNAANSDVEINEANFPDANFRSFVESLDSDPKDNKLTPDEIANITEIDCSENGIKSLKGIEYFTSLKDLNCSDNSEIKTLDLSKNTALENLVCRGLDLISLDLSKNINLIRVNCSYNSIKSLDIRDCTELKRLRANANCLTDIDLSNNVKLEELIIGKSSGFNELPRKKNLNRLTELDLSNNVLLKDLSCDFNLLTNLDLSKNINLEYLYCNDNKLRTLDLSKNVNLKGIECQNNQLASLDITKNANVSWCDASSNIYPYAVEGELLSEIDPALDVKRVSEIKGGNFDDGRVHFTTPEGKITYKYKMGTINDGPNNISDAYETFTITKHTHTPVKVPEKPATNTHDGVKEYYKCECGKFFEDKEATKRIPDINEWAKTDGKIPALGYKVIEGANSNWSNNEDGTITIRANGDFANFKGIKVDGNLVDSSNYIAKSGSTIVTLKNKYLKTLSAKEHTITFLYTDGECSTAFTVVDKTPSNENPKTSDETRILSLALMGIVSAAGYSFIKAKKEEN